MTFTESGNAPLERNPALIDYAKPIVNGARANQFRVDADFSATPFTAKVVYAEKLRVHTMLIIDGKDMEASAVSVRLHQGGPQGEHSGAPGLALEAQKVCLPYAVPRCCLKNVTVRSQAV